jgi:ATP-dependent Clp protease ATP-binding subunit ClpA
MERFTQRARRVLSLAQEAAESLNSALIDTDHLLLGIIREQGGIAARVLREMGIDPLQAEDLARAESKAKSTRSVQLDLSADSKKTLELAVDEARRMGHNYIGSEHLLLGLLRLQGCIALEILRKLDASPEEIRRQFITIMRERPEPRRDAPSSSRRLFSSNIEYFLLRTTSRSSGQISHLSVDLSTEVKDALEEALKEVGHTGVLLLEDRHLLLGLLQNHEGAVNRILLEMGIERDQLIHKLRRPTDD